MEFIRGREKVSGPYYFSKLSTTPFTNVILDVYVYKLKTEDSRSFDRSLFYFCINFLTNFSNLVKFSHELLKLALEHLPLPPVQKNFSFRSPFSYTPEVCGKNIVIG